jgi:sec-independent protein translocase protein TatA
MNLGAPEILLILVVALLVFGPQKLPEIGRQVGGAMRELRRMQDSVKSELQTAMKEDAPTYDKPAGAPLSDRPGASEVSASALEEPDHTDDPPPSPGSPPPDASTMDASTTDGITGDRFEGPPGSFR